MTSGWHVFFTRNSRPWFPWFFLVFILWLNTVPDKSQPPMDFDNSQCILTDIDLDRVFRCVSVAMHVALRFFSEVPKASGPISSAAVPKEVDAAVAWLSLQDVWPTRLPVMLSHHRISLLLGLWSKHSLGVVLNWDSRPNFARNLVCWLLMMKAGGRTPCQLT